MPVAIPPTITDESAPFWAAAREGRFLVERCTACGRHVFPMCGVCCDCGSRDLEMFDVTGAGEVYSLTVNHQQWMPGMERPFGIALVSFPDAPGVRLIGWVAEEHLDAIGIGVPVTLEFATTAGGDPIPTFRPGHA